MSARRIITPEQLKAGWVEFRRDEIPNTIQHQWANPVPRPDGNYEVDEPEVRDDRQPRCGGGAFFQTTGT